MRIHRQTVYVVNQRSFSTEAKAREHITDVLGEFVDRKVLSDNGILLGPGQRIKLVEALMKHSAALVEILDGCMDSPEKE